MANSPNLIQHDLALSPWSDSEKSKERRSYRDFLMSEEKQKRKVRSKPKIQTSPLKFELDGIDNIKIDRDSLLRDSQHSDILPGFSPRIQAIQSYKEGNVKCSGRKNPEMGRVVNNLMSQFNKYDPKKKRQKCAKRFKKGVAYPIDLTHKGSKKI